MATLLAVAGLSARMLAEAAHGGGYQPVALDLFGDADTRRVATSWLPIGDPARLRIDGEALLSALRYLRREGAVGWIAGAGFEAQPELLAAAAQLLPLLGNLPQVVARVRDPAQFFGRLAALGIAHPETRFVRPPSPLGWLRKNAASSGGWDVWPLPEVDAAALEPIGPAQDVATSVYYQRMATGTPMSALFLADGRRARLLGVNRQIVRRLGARPYLFRGCIGPLPVAPGLRRRLEEMLDALSANFGLRGLNGLDFLLDGEDCAVLEINARPPASIALYGDALPGGLLRAHLAASLEGQLPAVGDEIAVGSARPCGFEVVYARQRCRISVGVADAWAQLAWCHDLPAPGTTVGRGEPLCSVSAVGSKETEGLALLQQRRRQISSLPEQAHAGNEGLATRPLECQ
jgi:uncharacterized protein